MDTQFNSNNRASQDPTRVWGKPRSEKRRRRSGGNSIIEVALLSPWIMLLFAGALDLGFFNYALISVQSAARVAALYTSASSGTASDSTGACTYVLGELKGLPNARSLSTCSGVLSVSATALQGPDGQNASKVTVTYTTIPMIPIPGILNKQFTFTSATTMKLRG